MTSLQVRVLKNAKIRTIEESYRTTRESNFLSLSTIVAVSFCHATMLFYLNLQAGTKAVVALKFVDSIVASLQFLQIHKSVGANFP